MKRKHWLSLLLSSFLVSGALVGCSSSGEEENASNNSDDKITIEIFQGKVEFNDAFEALADVYESENQNIDIEITSVGGGTDYLSSLKTTFSTGDEPEIFSIAGPSEAEQFRDSLADVADTEAVKLALDGTLEGVTEGDEILGLPFNQEGYGLVYNKRIFEEAGINPADILTFDDLEAAVEKLDGMKEELDIEAVFALGASEKWILGNHLANAYLAPEFNNDVLEAYEAESVAFEKADEMKKLLDLQNDYSVQPTLNLDYSQQVEEYFSLERVAMIQQGNWIYPSVEQMDEEFAQEIGVLPLPVEGYEGSVPVGVPNYWGVNSNSDDEVIQAAKDFLDWMYTSEEGKRAVLEDFNFIPAYEGFDSDKIADPLSKEIYEYSSEGNTIGWVFAGYPSNAWGDILGANMQKYIAGEMTWNEVLEESRVSWEGNRQE